MGKEDDEGKDEGEEEKEPGEHELENTEGDCLEHLHVLAEPLHLANEEHHLDPGKEAANRCKLELPAFHGYYLRPRILVEGDQGEGEDEEDVDDRLWVLPVLLDVNLEVKSFV